MTFQGLPARICWLEYGERAEAGLKFNWLVKTRKVGAPIVIGRDHLDAGSVASPNRETEAMQDGSDAIADWPLLNALLNTACGASWVSIHHGGGVGIGYSIHAGMVVVADGSKSADRRLERVLTADPGTGVMRHADAGYEEAIRAHARRRRAKVDLPHGRAPGSQRGSPTAGAECRSCATSGACSPAARARGRREVARSRDAALAFRDGRITWVGRQRDLPAPPRRRRALGRPGAAGDPRPGRRPHPPGLRRLAGRGLRGPAARARATGRSPAGAAASCRRCKKTRAAGSEALYARCRGFLRAMLALGVTTVEAKSGYGLDLRTEARVLAVYAALARRGPQRLVPTYLGAHVVPPEYRAAAESLPRAGRARDRRPGQRRAGPLRRRVRRRERLHPRRRGGWLPPPARPGWA